MKLLLLFLLINDIFCQNLTQIDNSLSVTTLATTTATTTKETTIKNDNINQKISSTLNQNCTDNEDCTTKRTICDRFTKKCECDVTTMQMSGKCKLITCSSNDDCVSVFSNSWCLLNRCECISGRKLNGNCLQTSVQQIPLPEWAIIGIILSVIGSTLFGSIVKKTSCRRFLNIIKISKLFSDINDNDNNDNNDDQGNDINLNETLPRNRNLKV